MHRLAKIIIKCVFPVSVLIIILLYIRTYSLRDFILPANSELKHILFWTPVTEGRLKLIGLGQKGFIIRNCSYINCYITAAQRYFGDYTKFHAVVFSMPEFYITYKFLLDRRPEQKFVFSSVESSHMFPACSNRFDGYFNWTWTFRLDSDFRMEYIVIRDENKTIIGPNKIMHWMDLKNMRPVSDEFKKSLRSKTKAVAWFVSNCKTPSRREEYFKILEKELAEFNHTVDIYGKCGKLPWRCLYPEKKCYERIKPDYYFYLAFENSFNVDYVTEKVLTALQNNAIPIVYGQANYTRFMPDGIYLDATALTPKRIAEKIDYLIKNPDKYAEYFKWRNHYSYYATSDSPETDDYCALCKMLNDEEKFKKKSVVKNFREWWDSPDFCNKNYGTRLIYNSRLICYFLILNHLYVMSRID